MGVNVWPGPSIVYWHHPSFSAVHSESAAAAILNKKINILMVEAEGDEEEEGIVIV